MYAPSGALGEVLLGVSSALTISNHPNRTNLLLGQPRKSHRFGHRVGSANRWRARRLRNPLDRQGTDLTSIRFAVASGALGMAR